MAAWRLLSPASRENPDGPDEGGVDHVEEKGGEGDFAPGHAAHAHRLQQGPEHIYVHQFRSHQQYRTPPQRTTLAKQLSTKGVLFPNNWPQQ
jgi:hypothetical protein